MTATVNLTALRALRAKMTPGEWDAVDEFVYDEQRAIVEALQRDDNAAGIVATHAAADTLLEIAEAALALRDLPIGDRKALGAAYDRLDEALAKVSKEGT